MGDESQTHHVNLNKRVLVHMIVRHIHALETTALTERNNKRREGLRKNNWARSIMVVKRADKRRMVVGS